MRKKLLKWSLSQRWFTLDEAAAGIGISPRQVPSMYQRLKEIQYRGLAGVEILQVQVRPKLFVYRVSPSASAVAVAVESTFFNQ
jgi:hypothetical protein